MQFARVESQAWAAVSPPSLRLRRPFWPGSEAEPLGPEEIACVAPQPSPQSLPVAKPRPLGLFRCRLSLRFHHWLRCPDLVKLPGFTSMFPTFLLNESCMPVLSATIVVFVPSSLTAYITCRGPSRGPTYQGRSAVGSTGQSKWILVRPLKMVMLTW